jgi:hypothetical protein
VNILTWLSPLELQPPAEPFTDSDLALMAAMDRLHINYPLTGSSGLRDTLRR